MANKEIRTAIRLSRQVRKYRNAIQGHHLLQIIHHLGIEFNESALRNSAGFDPAFTGTFELSKSLLSKVPKVL